MIEYERIREVAGRSIQSLYPPDKRHKGIVCPLCGNGQGKDGDGVTFVRGSNVILKCFRCGFSGDVIKLTAQANNISYREAADILAGKLGLTEEKYKNNQNRQVATFKIPKFEHAKEIEPEEKIDQTEYFKKVEKFLSQTDYPAKRGLSEDTCRHFHIGYDAIWRHPKVPKAPVSPRLIIPTSKYSYLARDVRENLSDDQKRYSKQKFGSVALFNVKALEYEFVFVTEGEIDAISFYEVCRGNALALGSVSNIQKLADYLRTATSKPKFMIAALDNDSAGREGNLKLKQALKEFGICTLIADFIYTDTEKDIQYKDANEILVKNREAFIENIELLQEIPLKYYSSDKSASKILEEIGMTEDDGDEFEPYSDEELSQLIKEPEFNEKDIRSMFEEENFQPTELERVEEEANSVRKKFLDEGGAIKADVIPPPTKVILDRVERAKKYLNSLTEFSTHVVYSPKVLREWAFCYLYDISFYFDFGEKVFDYMNGQFYTKSMHDYVVNYAVSVIEELNTPAKIAPENSLP